MKPSLILKFLGLALGAFVIFLVAFAAYLGAFQSITIETKTLGPFHLVYLEQRGHYKQTGKTVSEVVRVFHNLGLKDVRGFGVFYDDPKKVAETDLRSEAGAILTDEELEKAQGAVKQFKMRDLPAKQGAVVVFPFKNSLSALVGVLRVYPKLVDYVVKSGKNPSYSLEVYDLNKTITYFMPIED